jgi:CheY-like chemotaxis protein
MNGNRGKTILIVDDDKDYLFQEETQLRAAGFNVITAECQEDAEQILKTTRPDLVISDLMMENIDGGFSLSHHIKQLDPKIPIIIVTGAANEIGLHFTAKTDEERSGLKAEAVLNKPVRFELLLAEIEKHLV